jgi:hypothetical protein
MDHINSVLFFRFINFKYTQYQEPRGSLNFEAHFLSSPESLMARGKLEFMLSTLATSMNSVIVTLLTTSDHQGTE